MSDKKSYVCGVTVFKDGLEKEPERMDTIKEYLKDQLVYKAVNEMDAGEYVITLSDVRSFDFPVPYNDQVDIKQKIIVQPLERKTGKWIREVLGSTSGYGTTVMYQCTNCEKSSISKYKFCPNCGAKMEGEER